MVAVPILRTLDNAVSLNFIQEQLSRAYTRAVIFRAGFRRSIPEVDDHGIDGTIVDPDRRGVNRVDFQLKATTHHEIRDDAIVYDLRVANYNSLTINDDVPRVLILFIMPVDDSQWLHQSLDELCLRKCAYWVSLMGMPRSRNSSTVRVEAPVTNVFDQNGLRDMFQRLIV